MILAPSLTPCIVLLSLGLMPAAAAAQYGGEVPQAAKNASRAYKGPAPKRPEPAVDRRSLLDVLAGALEENDDPNVRNLEAQFRPQFQQLLYVELAFLRRACNVDAKAFREVARAANVRLHVAVRAHAISQNARMRQPVNDNSETIDAPPKCNECWPRSSNRRSALNRPSVIAESATNERPVASVPLS